MTEANHASSIARASTFLSTGLLFETGSKSVNVRYMEGHALRRKKTCFPHHEGR